MNKKESLIFTKYFNFINNVKSFYQGKSRIIFRSIGVLFCISSYLLSLFLLDLEDWNTKFAFMICFTILYGVTFFYIAFKYLFISFNYFKYSKKHSDMLMLLFFLLGYIISYIISLIIYIIVTTNIFKTNSSGFTKDIVIIYFLPFIFLIFLLMNVSLRRTVNEDILFIEDVLILNKNIRKIEKVSEKDGHIGLEQGKVCTLKIYFSDSKYVLVKVFDSEEKILMEQLSN